MDEPDSSYQTVIQYGHALTEMSGHEETPVDGLSPLTSYDFRCLAVSRGGSVAGPATTVTTGASPTPTPTPEPTPPAPGSRTASVDISIVFANNGGSGGTLTLSGPGGTVWSGSSSSPTAANGWSVTQSGYYIASGNPAPVEEGDEHYVFTVRAPDTAGQGSYTLTFRRNLGVPNGNPYLPDDGGAATFSLGPPPPVPGPKAWDAGHQVGTASNGTTPNGRLLQPVDQTGATPTPQPLRVKVGQSLDMEVEAATDYDHWTQDLNGNGSIGAGESGDSADAVSYRWSGGGTFEDGKARSTPWSALTPGVYTLTCRLDDAWRSSAERESKTGVSAPEEGTRNDEGPNGTAPVLRTVQVVVYDLTVRFRSPKVAAGAKNDSAHQAVFEIKVGDGSDGVGGITVPTPTIESGGLGPDESVTASLVMNGTTTGENGKVTGVFTSGNRTENTVIKVEETTASIGLFY